MTVEIIKEIPLVVGQVQPELGRETDQKPAQLEKKKLPSELRVVLIRPGGESESLELREALKEVITQKVEGVEERRDELSRRLGKKIKQPPHGDRNLRSRPEQRQIRESFAGEMRERSSALDSRVLSILHGPDNSSEVSFGDVRFPRVVKKFYYLICDNPVTETKALLDNPESLQILWKCYYARYQAWEIYKNSKEVDKKIREKEANRATDAILESLSTLFIPPELNRYVGQITRNFEFTDRVNHTGFNRGLDF